ncbi:hypothetical protein OBBRIDRAFT_369390 [Obba rivulosa]|uniref:Protein byr4 n=1 Tax=Obba rivulosa TaxID=1052685 RepID=A0A8E2DV39_9APHY|nr:hypothetical protein OBBRIDRAFT_369390 [Obba rivulosa]
MSTVPAPTIVLSREEWPDADFDLPDGEPLHASDAESDKDDCGPDDDWDVEMDLGKTGGAKVSSPLDHNLRQPGPSIMPPQVFTIRPPLHDSPIEDDDEGVSTIRVAALPRVPPKSAQRPPSPVDEDFEDDFALPSDLTQLSLRPSSLAHRSSKASIEWGDKDQTVSSQSSDAYSTFSFADNSPSSNCTSASLPESETEEDEDEGELDGLVIPTGLFESGQGAKKLAKILEKKKATFTDDHIKVVSPDPEDDFEIGLIIDNDVELSPSRLVQHTQTVKRSVPSSIRSKSVPPRPPASLRPPSRLKNERIKEPSNPPVSSAQQFRKLNGPPSPPSRPAVARVQTYSQALTSNPPPSSPSFLTPKPGSLRVQKSHSGLKPSSSPTSTRNLGRKASLPSLSESTQAQASGSTSSGFTAAGAFNARYDAPTASSRAKTHSNSASRLHVLDYTVPPARPSTPSSNPAALRLTLPTSSSRMKLRAPISAVFPQTIAPPVPPIGRSASPLHTPRPPSSTSAKPPSRSGHVQTQSLPSQSTVKVLKRPKRQRTYGDGTELDGFEDLPLDRDKEGRYRVQPKGAGGRIPGGSFPKQGEAVHGKGTVSKKGQRQLSFNTADVPKNAAPTVKTLKRTGRIEFNAKSPEPTAELPKARAGELTSKKRKAPAQASGPTCRKPTLIRNLGGASAPKVVGEMKWNPSTLRWEGNDHVLRDFDAAVGTSTRPALITHLTGSSIGSPVGSFAAGARIVGNMIFDPSRMCWISTLSPEEDEPDVFADLADDEDDDWEAKASTIRASQQPQGGSAAPADISSSTESRTPTSPSRKHVRSHSETESDRCSRASMVCDVDDSFAETCREAEQRHRAELKGWISSPAASRDAKAEIDRSYLYEIRALATRQY